jgi:hypothetical protein
MKKTGLIFFLLFYLVACRKESLTDIIKQDNRSIINQLSTSWELTYIDSYYTLDVTAGDVMVLYQDSKCTLYTPGDASSYKNDKWMLNSSLYSLHLECIKGTVLNDADWNIDELTDDDLWLSKSAGGKILSLRFSKK